MMIYQGLELNSLFNLRVQDIDLVRGRIFMREHNTRQERYFALKVHQILNLANYINKRLKSLRNGYGSANIYLPQKRKLPIGCSTRNANNMAEFTGSISC